MPFASGRRQHLHLDERVVHALAPDGQKLMLRYDSLVVAAWCTDAYFGHDEWVVFAPGLKTLAADGDRVGHIAAVSLVTPGGGRIRGKIYLACSEPCG
jgi:NADH dehydrogenase FAD-containing subunit